MPSCVCQEKGFHRKKSVLKVGMLKAGKIEKLKDLSPFDKGQIVIRLLGESIFKLVSRKQSHGHLKLINVMANES